MRATRHEMHEDVHDSSHLKYVKNKARDAREYEMQGTRRRIEYEST